MKSIYEFNLTKKISSEITEVTDNGKLIKTVEEEKPVKIIFKKPSRLESEEADMIYAIEYGKCVRAGILTRPLIEKLYDEREKSGILSDNFAERYITLYERFFVVQNEFTKLDLKEAKSDADDKKLNELATEFAGIKNDLQGLESSRNSLFQNTAETKAQNKTILWLTLFLTFTQEDEKNEPVEFFKGSTFEEKLAFYDSVIENEDEFCYKVVDKTAFFVALWYLGRASSKEDFLNIEKSLNSSTPPPEKKLAGDLHDEELKYANPLDEKKEVIKRKRESKREVASE